MSTEVKKSSRLQCPHCGKKAKRVSPETLCSLLSVPFVKGDGSDEQSCCGVSGEGCTPITKDTGWRFCDSADCEVVYFSEEGDTRFTKSQLRVSVGVKETHGERPLCYCFGHSVASIKNELQAKGHSDALDDIRAKMKDPGCHCETSNPSGSCCLGSVAKGIKAAEKELRMHEPKLTPYPSATSSSRRGESIAKIGTVISAMLASACCWLPLLLLAVGVSGAGIAATLETYRPLFVVVTFGFLVAAFYFTYRPRKATNSQGADCCNAEEVSCCPPTGNRRFSVVALNKAMLWGVTILAVAFLLFPSYVGMLFATGGNETVGTEELNQAVFQIDGMTCDGCATIVAQAIRRIPGVEAVEVSYEQKQATVSVARGQSPPVQAIISALDKAGYRGGLRSETQTQQSNGSAATGAGE